MPWCRQTLTGLRVPLVFSGYVIAPTLLLLPLLSVGAVDTIPAMTNGTGPLEGPTLLGDLGGLRSGFAQHGLEVAAHIIADGSMYSRDGAVSGERGGIRYLIEAGATMNFEKFLGLTGAGSVTATWQTVTGDDLRGETNVLQSETWLNTADRTQVGRLFYVQPFFDGGFIVKAGKDEVVRDFASNPLAADFLNASARSEPTAYAMPTFPDSATMAMAGLNISGWVARFGMYDGRSVTTGKETGSDWLDIPDSDVFMIAEAGFTNDDFNDGHQSGVVIGAWQHSGTFTGFDGQEESDVRGYYLQGDVKISEETGTRTPQGLAGWMQLGLSDENFSVYHRHVALGLVWRGLIPTRDRDAIGISQSWLATSRATNAPTDANERVFELYYTFTAAGWLLIQPDLQWFTHPGGDSIRPDLFVGSLRGTLVF
jgi:carbohydrate-selective porin OprB